MPFLRPKLPACEPLGINHIQHSKCHSCQDRAENIEQGRKPWWSASCRSVSVSIATLSTHDTQAKTPRKEGRMKGRKSGWLMILEYQQVAWTCDSSVHHCGSTSQRSPLYLTVTKKHKAGVITCLTVRPQLHDLSFFP